MISVSLTRDEIELLVDVLRSCISDLGMEIADTDNMAFREELKGRRHVLEEIVERFDTAKDTGPGA